MRRFAAAMNPLRGRTIVVVGCRFEIQHATPGLVVLADLGPWERYKTVTNRAEEVVEWLRASCLLLTGPRLFYYDSEGDLAEILYSVAPVVFRPVELDDPIVGEWNTRAIGSDIRRTLTASDGSGGRKPG